MGWTELNMLLILIVWGGGQDRPCKARFSEKCPCSYHNNTALKKSLFDTALVMSITIQSKIGKE